jgi:hypothetical protein
MVVLLTATVGPLLYGTLASFMQWPPATWVISYTVRSDGRYPVFATAFYTYLLIAGCLIVALLPAVLIKKLIDRTRRSSR